VEQYIRIQVTGQAKNTVDAKQQDLACFLTFCVKLYDHEDRREWYVRPDEHYLADTVDELD
jgi:hypothetical protein